MSTLKNRETESVLASGTNVYLSSPDDPFLAVQTFVCFPAKIPSVGCK